MDCDDGVWSHHFVRLVGRAVGLGFAAVAVVICGAFLRFCSLCDAVFEGDGALLVSL